MIKVNLAGTSRKKPAKAARKKIALPVTIMPVVLVLIVLGSAASGYLWYSSLTTQNASLDDQIRNLKTRKAELEAVIKQDQVFETRKKMLEARIKIIDDLLKNQVSPVLALDQLAEAVDRTQFVWLSGLDQKEGILTMNGTGTSLSAIADFYTNLNATGYFRNIDLGPSQESSGNFTFSLKCEFVPPHTVPTSVPAVMAGGINGN